MNARQSGNPADFFTNKRILVTGGAGFVGANLVRALSTMGASRLTVLDNLFTGRIKNLSGLVQSAEFIQGSVEDAALVRTLIAETDVVFHLAARNIIVSTADPCSDFETNVRGTFNILEACRENQVERVVFTSSASVYGNPVHLPIDENDPTYPLNPYAASKLSAESYCRAYYEMYCVPMTVVRYSNVYGPYQSPDNPYCGVVSKFIQRALDGMPLKIHGDGDQTRDFTYVDDAVEATIKACVEPKAVGEMLNIGTGVEVSVNRLVELIGGATRGREFPLIVEHVNRRDIDNVRRRVIGIERARRILRWQPRVSIGDGVSRTVEWVRSQAKQG